MIDVTESNLNTVVLNSEKPVILFFWAPWCGPCRMMPFVLTELEHEHPELMFCQINVDEAPEIGTRYDILSIPTFIVISTGEEIGRLVGAMPKHKLIAEIEHWLEPN